MDSVKQLCYVVTPYGTKSCAVVRQGSSDKVEIDFEAVFANIIGKGASLVKGRTLEVLRSKDEKKPGGITEKFIKGILTAEIAIIDATDGNANVFYELGLRHAFKERVSIIIAAEGTVLPFDIRDLGVIFYDHTTEEGCDKAAREIAVHIETALGTDSVDSPVFNMIPGYRVKLPIKKCTAAKYKTEFLVRGCASKRIGIKAGDLSEIRDVDVWVNSENTSMEMGRICECSVSSLIRYHGALRDDVTGRVRKDLIQSLSSETTWRGQQR